MVRITLIAATLVLAGNLPTSGQDSAPPKVDFKVMGPDGQDIPPELQEKVREIEEWLQTQNVGDLMVMFETDFADPLNFPEWSPVLEFAMEAMSGFDGACLEFEQD